MKHTAADDRVEVQQLYQTVHVARGTHVSQAHVLLMTIDIEDLNGNINILLRRVVEQYLAIARLSVSLDLNTCKRVRYWRRAHIP